MAIRRSTDTAAVTETEVKVQINRENEGEKMNTEAPKTEVKAIEVQKEVLLKSTGSNNLTDRQMLNLRVKLEAAGFSVTAEGKGFNCEGVTMASVMKLTKILTGYIGWKLEAILETAEGKSILKINRK